MGLWEKPCRPIRAGQNPIEPIAFGIPLVVGPNYQNFHETCSDMFAHGAAIQTNDPGEVFQQLVRAARDKNLRNKLSFACTSWMEKQGSPSEFTLNLIKKKMEI